MTVENSDQNKKGGYILNDGNIIFAVPGEVREEGGGNQSFFTREFSVPIIITVEDFSYRFRAVVTLPASGYCFPPDVYLKAEPGMPGHIVDQINSALKEAINTQMVGEGNAETTVIKRIRDEVLPLAVKYRNKLDEEAKKEYENQTS